MPADRCAELAQHVLGADRAARSTRGSSRRRAVRDVESLTSLPVSARCGNAGTLAGGMVAPPGPCVVGTRAADGGVGSAGERNGTQIGGVGPGAGRLHAGQTAAE